MTKPKAFLVYDIGKTNKKALYYSPQLKLLNKKSKQIDVLFKDQLELEDIESIKNWLFEELRIAIDQYHIEGIGITCHGATFALLDENDQLIEPILSYTSQIPQENQDSFFALYGNSKDLQLSTSTPDLGFINIGKQVHYIKEKRSKSWSTSKSFLFYPQYLGFLLSDQKSIEISYLGNHSYMWDYQNNEYSKFTKDSGLVDKIQERVQKPFELLGNMKQSLSKEFGISYDIPIAVGIHDSNASILPYLYKEKTAFTLLSTGTWCVGIKPNQPYELNQEDLKTKTFFNLDAFGKPLRTSICPIGYEYEEYTKIYPHQDPNQLLDAERLNRSNIFILPGILESTSIFSHSKPGLYINEDWFSIEEIKKNPSILNQIEPDEFYQALNASLAIQASELLSRLHIKESENIFIEGGFIQNQNFLSCLKAIYPKINLMKTNLKEATAYGTAITTFIASKQSSAEKIEDYIQFESENITFKSINNIQEYITKFHQRIGEKK